MEPKSDIKVFDRIEKKYLITKSQKEKILKVIKEHMREDSYFISEVFNIYFDNENYDLIIQSIDQPKFKEKLRARSYGGYNKVFFEIKTKIRGKDNNAGYKRRVQITKKDYDKLVKDGKKVTEFIGSENDTDLQIAKEVDYLIDHFNLRPKILILYDRESYQGEDGLRITFDENLRYRTKNVKFTKTKTDKYYFDNEKNIIMEIKAHGVLPLWLVRALTEERIFPEQFSKVGKSFYKIRKEQNV
ncbi:polyphosphate polymerase domain-containing protein [Candidatus Saccharibacteria bacterium]|nr:polyphosphate polymerase domain-containing protein [Candidatus Saccharibacteria bacterium]